MITLTRLTGTVFALNSDLIERVDSTPDTVITLVDGKKYLVTETVQQVVTAVLAYRGGIIAESARLHMADAAELPPPSAPETPRHLAAVPLGDRRSQASGQEEL